MRASSFSPSPPPGHFQHALPPELASDILARAILAHDDCSTRHQQQQAQQLQRTACMQVCRAWAMTARSLPPACGWTTIQPDPQGLPIGDGVRQMRGRLEQVCKLGPVESLHVIVSKHREGLGLSRVQPFQEVAQHVMPTLPQGPPTALKLSWRIDAGNIPRGLGRPSLLPLAAHLKQLTTLDLSTCEFPPPDLPALVQHVPHLETLLLTGMPERLLRYCWPHLDGETQTQTQLPPKYAA